MPWVCGVSILQHHIVDPFRCDAMAQSRGSVWTTEDEQKLQTLMAKKKVAVSSASDPQELSFEAKGAMTDGSKRRFEASLDEFDLIESEAAAEVPTYFVGDVASTPLESDEHLTGH